jgi:hypothetical protein
MSPILFEQPVARNDWEGLDQVTKQANKLYGEGPSPYRLRMLCRLAKNSSQSAVVVIDNVSFVPSLDDVESGQ